MGHPFATHHNFSPLLQAIGNTIIISLLESLFLALDLLIVLWLLRRFHFAAPINLYRITFLAYVWLFTSTIWIFLQSFKQPKYETIDNQTFAMLALSMPDALDKFLFIREYISDFVINNVKYWLCLWLIVPLTGITHFIWQQKKQQLPPLSNHRENFFLYTLLIFISFNPLAWWLIAKIRGSGKFVI